MIGYAEIIFGYTITSLGLSNADLLEGKQNPEKNESIIDDSIAGKFVSFKPSD